MTERERLARWAEAVLEGEAGAVAATLKGGRHNQLRRSSFKVGQRFEIGGLSEHVVMNRLLQAALTTELSEREARYVILKSISTGKQHPRGPSENENDPRRSPTSKRTPPQPVVPPAPRRPPLHEVVHLLRNLSGPVYADAEVSAWHERRNIDPYTAADRGLVYALRRDVVRAAHPAWAFFGEKSWSELGYRVLLPMYDHVGRVKSAHARNIDPNADPKGLFPRGCEVVGLVLADAGALHMLRTRELAGPVWVFEGAPDYLTAATSWGDAADPAPSVVGIVAGSWTPAIAARAPDGAHVTVATHDDTAGESYAVNIAGTLQGRATLERWLAEVQ